MIQNLAGKCEDVVVDETHPEGSWSNRHSVQNQLYVLCGWRDRTIRTFRCHCTYFLFIDQKKSRNFRSTTKKRQKNKINFEFFIMRTKTRVKFRWNFEKNSTHLGRETPQTRVQLSSPPLFFLVWRLRPSLLFFFSTLQPISRLLFPECVCVWVVIFLWVRECRDRRYRGWGGNLRAKNSVRIFSEISGDVLCIKWFGIFHKSEWNCIDTI